MGLEDKPELQLLTSAAYVAGRPSVEPLLDQARNLAYSHSDVVLRQTNPNEVATVLNIQNGIEQAPTVVDFNGLHVNYFQMSGDLGAIVNPATPEAVPISVHGTRNLTDTHQKAQVQMGGADPLSIDSDCNTSGGLISCTIDVKDPQGKLLLVGKSTSDAPNNEYNFNSTTDYYDPSTKSFKAEIDQHVTMEDANGKTSGSPRTLDVETTVNPKAKPIMQLGY